MIFFEQSTSDIVGPTGFKTGPGGKEYNDRQVYSYHIYCGPVDSDGNPSYIIECDCNLKIKLSYIRNILISNTFFKDSDEYSYFQAMSDLKTLGCGGFLTEVIFLNLEYFLI